MRDAVKEDEAKLALCPFRNSPCVGRACMAWVVSWKDNSEGFCTALRATYEQDIDEGWKKHGHRLVSTRKDLIIRLKKAEDEVKRLKEIERRALEFKAMALPLENRNYHPKWYVAAMPLFASLSRETTTNV